MYSHVSCGTFSQMGTEQVGCLVCRPHIEEHDPYSKCISPPALCTARNATLLPSCLITLQLNLLLALTHTSSSTCPVPRPPCRIWPCCVPHGLSLLLKFALSLPKCLTLSTHLPRSVR